MSEFLIQKLPYDLSSHAGLALVGKYLAHIKFDRLVDRPFAVRSGVRNSAILKSYLALSRPSHIHQSPSISLSHFHREEARMESHEVLAMD